MNRFIKFKQEDNYVLVNVDHIQCVVPYEAGTDAAVIFLQSEKIGVSEPFDTVIEKITSL